MTCGHWFCSTCDDITFLPSHISKIGVQKCPVCHKKTANFVPDSEPQTKPTEPPKPKTVTDEQAKFLFEQMKII